MDKIEQASTLLNCDIDLFWGLLSIERLDRMASAKLAMLNKPVEIVPSHMPPPPPPKRIDIVKFTLTARPQLAGVMSYIFRQSREYGSKFRVFVGLDYRYYASYGDMKDLKKIGFVTGSMPNGFLITPKGEAYVMNKFKPVSAVESTIEPACEVDQETGLEAVLNPAMTLENDVCGISAIDNFFGL